MRVGLRYMLQRDCVDDQVSNYVAKRRSLTGRYRALRPCELDSQFAHAHEPLLVRLGRWTPVSCIRHETVPRRSVSLSVSVSFPPVIAGTVGQQSMVPGVIVHRETPLPLYVLFPAIVCRVDLYHWSFVAYSPIGQAPLECSAVRGWHGSFQAMPVRRTKESWRSSSIACHFLFGSAS